MKVQIGIDDLCPRPTQGLELWPNVEKLLAVGLKVDLFVTFAMIRDGDGPYILTDYTKFVDQLHEISERPGVALNVHGYNHSCLTSNNDEFLLSDYKALDAKLTAIDKIIDETGLDFKRVFRPPAFKISPEGVNALKDHGYTHLSLYKGHRTGHLYTPLYNKLNLDGIKVHYSNCAPPSDELIDGDLSATYHFTTSLKNALTDQNVTELLYKIRSPASYNIFET
tara:strand:+ start:1430 stop:2101 length:672 start_codon:yes stop_codon:yes gene_type:complete